MAPQISPSAANLTPNAYEYSGLRFVGWNTDEDGAGDSYLDASSFPFTSSATLYAQWSEVGSGGNLSSSGGRTSATKDPGGTLAATGTIEMSGLPLAAAILLGSGVVLGILRRRFLRIS